MNIKNLPSFQYSASNIIVEKHPGNSLEFPRMPRLFAGHVHYTCPFNQLLCGASVLLILKVVVLCSIYIDVSIVPCMHGSGLHAVHR